MTTAETSSAPKQRLSTGQMIHLMRLEVDQALHHGYPISCMVYGLDGFLEGDQVLLRKKAMPAVFQCLKEVTFENKVRGLGVWTESFQMAVFPHTAPDKLQELAESLLAKARALDVEDIPEEFPVTLSIGISHNLHQGEVSFETIISEAETGMGLAMQSGGDSIAEFRETETELDRLKEELQSSIADIQEVQKELFGDTKDKDVLWGKKLVEKVLTLFTREPEQSEGLLRLEKEVIALLKFELAEWTKTSSASQMIESQRQIAMLERRVEKLTESLGMTEQELKRVAAMKNIDLGISSLYRTVQGLSDDDENAEAKKSMLQNLFEANVALQKEVAASRTS